MKEEMKKWLDCVGQRFEQFVETTRPSENGVQETGVRWRCRSSGRGLREEAEGRLVGGAFSDSPELPETTPSRAEQ